MIFDDIVETLFSLKMGFFCVILSMSYVYTYICIYKTLVFNHFHNSLIFNKLGVFHNSLIINKLYITLKYI